MKIRRFTAATMREALALVREELGPDAAIVTNRRVERGIEIIAAADYDADLAVGALAAMVAPRREPTQQAPAAAVEDPAAPPPGEGGFQSMLRRLNGSPSAAAEEPERDAAASRSAEAGAEPPASLPAGSGPRVVWSQDGEIVAMRREVEALRRMLEYQLARLAWDDLARREPFRAKVLRDLSSLDIAPDLARQLVNSMPAITNPEDAGRVALALLVRHLPVVEDGLLDRGGSFALVGPTGVGKTTTIAKLAARYAARHGPGSVGLISIDGYRIGAREQLAAFARILGVPVKVAGTPAELDAARKVLSRRSLVLVDTAGVGQRDLRLREQCALVRSQGEALRPLLVLPANADLATLDDIVRAHEPLAPAACVLTKIDEAASLGPAMSAAMRGGVPIAHLCDGQRVPDDLHAAPAKRIWLIRKAVKLRQLSGRAADDDYLAEHFGRVGAHA